MNECEFKGGGTIRLLYSRGKGRKEEPHGTNIFWTIIC